MKKVLILNYHLIDNGQYPFDHFGGIYAVTAAAFREQMEILHRNSIPVIGLDELINGQVIEDFSVAITIDDGNPSDYDVVYPLLAENGFTSSFFLSVNNMQKNGVYWKQYGEMLRDGFSIGSHGLTHSDLTTLEAGKALYELTSSRQIVEENTGARVNAFSLPFGRYNTGVLNMAAEAGYEAVLSTRFRLYQPGSGMLMDRWSIKRNTRPEDFERLVCNDKTLLRRYHFLSSAKNILISGMGSSLTNSLYTIKNRISG